MSEPLESDPPIFIQAFDATGHIRRIDEVETAHIRLAIGRYPDNMSEVARRLGIGRSTLYRKIQGVRT